jgi:hypothetical protein
MKKVVRWLRVWSDKLSPAAHRVLSVALIIAVAAVASWVMLGIVIPALNMATAEAIASVAVIVTVVLASINLIATSLNRHYSSKQQLTLAVKNAGTKTIVTSTIENRGAGRITPRSFYLFLDSGVLNTSSGYAFYEFPDVLTQEGCDYDCALAVVCKKGKIQTLPDHLIGPTFRSSFHACYLLRHIAANSVSFVDPGESISEDTAFELPAGVYRVLLVGISEETDCMCTHKVFVVESPAPAAVRKAKTNARSELPAVPERI